MKKLRFKPSPEEMRKQDEKAGIEIEAFRLIHLVAAEFESDPMSVQCFDLRTVDRVIYVSRLLKEYDKGAGGFG